MKMLLHAVLILLALPILLLVYQPGWHLGGAGLLLGAVGMTLSPLILFGYVAAYILKGWKER